MAINFKGEGLKTKRIISSDVNSPLKIYSSNIESNQDDGTVLDANLLNNVGDDVFLFISGSTDSKNKSLRGVSLFGGDVVVSGTLYAERQVIEVDESVPGKLLVSGSLYVTGSSLFNVNNDQNSDFTIRSKDKNYALNINSLNNTIQIMSGGNSLSPNESEYTDTNFFVSGSIGSAYQPDLGQIGNGERGTGVFGGDLFVSGSLWANGINLTNNTNSGQVISLKGYVENGQFTPSRSTVTGDDSIALGYNHEIESKNSFVLGSYNNKIYHTEKLYNTIIGSVGSEISGSTAAVILGGFNNVIKDDASPSALILSDNANIQRTEVVGIYATNLFASGSGQENIVIGKDNKIEGILEDRSDNNFLLGRNNKVFHSRRVFTFNFADSEKFNNINNKSTENIISGSKNSFIISEGNSETSGSKSNFLYLDSSNVSLTKDSFLKLKDSEISSLTSSIVFTENSEISDSNRLVSIGSFYSNYKDDTIVFLKDRLTALGLSDQDYENGFNSILGSSYSNISGSYNSLFGGLKNDITGSTSTILGSLYSKIIGHNSLVLGGINNDTSGDDNLIIGNENTNDGNNNFIIGNKINNNNSNVFIIGDGDQALTSFVLSGSKFEFGDLNKEKLYGNDTSFFVSGSIGARERFLNGETDHDQIYGVSVFGGDLHVSGNLSGGNFELDNVFFDGGDSKGRDRSIGNNDEQSLKILTSGINRINLSSSGEVNIGGLEDVGSKANTQLHIRTGSLASYDFDSSLDLSPKKSFPLLISRNIQQTQAGNIPEKEVGIGFAIFPTLNLGELDKEDEPGAAITHKIKGRNSKGDLLFKTKTEDGQLGLGDPGSLTTKLTLTSQGELLLGNDNPDNNYIDLRVDGSNFPLIQASGSNLTNRGIYIGDNNNIGSSQSDTIFHVHGQPDSKISSRNNKYVSSFGGDVVISGSLYIEKDLDITGSIYIEENINSKDDTLNINSSKFINLNAAQDVNVSNDIVVVNNITGSHIKGDGLEISNVNKSSIYSLEIDPSTGNEVLVLGDFIDGNTGLHAIDLRKTLEAVLNNDTMPDGSSKILYSPTTNTRLYDTYFEIEKDNIGQVKYTNAVPGFEGTKPIETERVESPEHLIISLK